MKQHIKELADDFSNAVDYEQQPPMVFKNSNDYTIVIGEHRLQAFKKLGYAVCHNKLDEHGKKVYIHHNMRTFKEKKQ